MFLLDTNVLSNVVAAQPAPSVATWIAAQPVRLRYRSRRAACAESKACARPLPHRAVTVGLIVATVLVAGALALDFHAPFFY